MKYAPNYYDKVVPYFTPQAQEAYDQLIELGFDSDLAVTLIEHIAGGDESVYALPAEDGDDEE